MSKRTRSRQRGQREQARAVRRERAAKSVDLERVLDDLRRSLAIPPVAYYPGGADDSLSDPARIKFEYATFIEKGAPGRPKLKQLESDYARGKLSFLPEVEHWAMEKFFWHGLPGDAWHPLEAYLEAERDRFSATARDQLRRWKEAELNVFEIGALQDDCTLALRAWDLLAAKPLGAWFRAIDLSIGGVNVYHGK